MNTTIAPSLPGTKGFRPYYLGLGVVAALGFALLSATWQPAVPKTPSYAGAFAAAARSGFPEVHRLYVVASQEQADELRYSWVSLGAEGLPVADTENWIEVVNSPSSEAVFAETAREMQLVAEANPGTFAYEIHDLRMR